MTPGARRKRSDQIKVSIGPFRNLSDYKTCEEIQREVWKFRDIDIVPVSVLLTADQCGGLVLGAYNNLGDMIGFGFSVLGSDNGKMIQCSQMIGVRTAYRNFEVGYKIKLAMRKECLKRKIGFIIWAFDPMQPLNAYFNLGKLGAVAEAYKEDYYGEATSALDRGLPTDRFLTRWELSSRRVVDRLEHGVPKRDLRKDLKLYPVINRLQEIAPGMAGSSPIKTNCTDENFLFEVPYNLPDIKNRNLGVALEWQGKLRQVFRNYFKKGYACTDFWVAEQDGRLRSFYFLSHK